MKDMMPLFVDDKSKEFLMRLAEKDYILNCKKLEITKLRINIKKLLEPVRMITLH